MKTHDRRHHRRGLKAKAVAVAAGALALTLGTTMSASANGTGTVTAAHSATHNSTGKTAFSTQDAAAGGTWAFGIDGRDSTGTVWTYPPKTSGFGTKVKSAEHMGSAGALFKNASAGDADVNLYASFGGQLRIYRTEGAGTVIGNGWNIYNTFVTPGNLGGAANPDLLTRDGSGVLWLYLSYSNGTFAARTRIGGGWNAYTQLAGYGDLSGDGKADIVARDGSGVLWLYKGTGNYKAPFAARTRIGGGWNTYNRLLGLGDTNSDGKYDLIARDRTGKLWFYPGTGKASAPYGARVLIGSGGWNAFNYLF